MTAVFGRHDRDIKHHVSEIINQSFGSRNDRTLRRMRKVVEQINRMEPDMEKLSDDELKAKTNEFRARPRKASRWKA